MSFYNPFMQIMYQILWLKWVVHLLCSGKFEVWNMYQALVSSVSYDFFQSLQQNSGIFPHMGSQLFQHPFPLVIVIQNQVIWATQIQIVVPMHVMKVSGDLEVLFRSLVTWSLVEVSGQWPIKWEAAWLLVVVWAFLCLESNHDSSIVQPVA